MFFSLTSSLCAQSCLTLCGPMDCSPPVSSVCGIFQASILEWVAISYSGGSFRPRDQTRVSCVSCIGRQFFTTSTSWEAQVSSTVTRICGPWGWIVERVTGLYSVPLLDNRVKTLALYIWKIISGFLHFQ